MKLDNDTLEIFKNFAAINPSLMIKPGNTIRAISLATSVIAKAKLKQSFEKPLAIYDLSNFIAVLSLFDPSILDFSDDRFVNITNESKSAHVTYFYADPSLLILAPEKEMAIPNSNIKFRLTKETLSDVIKAMSVLSLPEVVFVGDGTNISVQTIDPKNPTSNLYRKVVAAAESVFMAYFKVDNINKLITADYDVTITAPKTKDKPGIAHFNSPNIEYWIVVEHHSKL